MFDRYIIIEGTLANVNQNGRVTGFSFQARCGYYNRLIISMIEELQVAVDGTDYPRESIRFTLHDRTLTLDEMETEYRIAWEFGAPALITVLSPGGLAPGEHEISLYERLRISYMPQPREPRTHQRQVIAA